MTENGAFTFIIGSPRSGTTVLGEILDQHDRICQWYEPYFVMDRNFRNFEDDERQSKQCTPKIRKQIRKDFLRYRERLGCDMIVDKSPRNSLKIPFLRTVFPKARFIHIIRDGRDTTLSIHKEWIKWKAVIKDNTKGGRFNYLKAAKVLKSWLDRQPFILDKLRALWFETHGHVLNKSKNLNRLRWNGEIGWGPKFKDWESFFKKVLLIQFNAYQWQRCVKKVLDNWDDIPEDNRLEVRYENLIQQPERTITGILKFLGYEADSVFFNKIPKVKKNNFNKWKTEFNNVEISQIKPILSPLLDELGYTQQYPW